MILRSMSASQKPEQTASLWAVGKRVLSVHPGVYLSALLSTWLVLLGCTYISRETDMHKAAQRIKAEQVAAFKQPGKSDTAIPPVKTSHEKGQEIRSSLPAQAAPPVAAPKTAGNQLPPWHQFTRMFQSQPAAKPSTVIAQKPATTRKQSRRSNYGLVPPPPPVAGLVPPPPPTVPIPMSMLTPPSPAFGQNISASQPIPAGPGAAAATTPYYSPELFLSQAYAPQAPPPAMDAGYAAPPDSFKVVRFKQRKRTIAYR